MLGWKLKFFYQRNFTSEMARVPFKSLFWDANDSIAKLMIFITSGVSLRDSELITSMCHILTAIANAKHLPQYKTRFSFVTE